MSKLESCPHCGGTAGYYQKQRTVYNQAWSWEGETIWADGGEQYPGESKAYKYIRCLGCNKIVNKFVEGQQL